MANSLDSQICMLDGATVKAVDASHSFVAAVAVVMLQLIADWLNSQYFCTFLL